jgi:hypothetical protein
MPHPEKARGVQAHACTCVLFNLYILSLGLVLGAAGPVNSAMAETAALNEVRVGYHGAYIRIVFELSKPFQYELADDAATGTVSIRFLDTILSSSGAPIHIAPDCLDGLSTVQEGNHAVASMVFNPIWSKLNPFTIQEPDRLVLDVFCGQTPIATEPQTVKQKIAAQAPEPVPEMNTVAAKPIQTVAKPSLQKPETVPSDAAEPVQRSNGAPEKNDPFQRYLLLILAAITGIIILLIALIFLQKKSHSAGQAAGFANTADDPEDRMRAIDTQIKEKLMRHDE